MINFYPTTIIYQNLKKNDSVQCAFLKSNEKQQIANSLMKSWMKSFFKS